MYVRKVNRSSSRFHSYLTFYDYRSVASQEGTCCSHQHTAGRDQSAQDDIGLAYVIRYGLTVSYWMKVSILLFVKVRTFWLEVFVQLRVQEAIESILDNDLQQWWCDMTSLEPALIDCSTRSLPFKPSLLRLLLRMALECPWPKVNPQWGEVPHLISISSSYISYFGLLVWIEFSPVLGPRRDANVWFVYGSNVNYLDARLSDQLQKLRDSLCVSRKAKAELSSSTSHRNTSSRQ